MRAPSFLSSVGTRRTALFAFAGIVAACAGALLFPAVRQPLAEQLGLSKPEAPRCEPKPGMSAAYRLHMDTQMKVYASALLLGRHAPGKAATSDVGLSAKLRVSAVEPRAQGMLMALVLDDLEGDDTGVELAKRDRAQLTAAFYAVLDRDCSFSSFGFQRGIEDDVVNRLQGLLQALSLSVQHDPQKNTWLSREHDSVGQYSARYTQSEDSARSLEKRREAYLRTHAPAGFGMKESMVVDVIESSTPVVLDEQFAWLEKLDSREHLRIRRAKGGVVAELDNTLELQRLAEKAAPIALVKSWAELRWRRTSASPLVATPRLQEPPDAYKSMPLPAALAQYTELMGSGQPSAALEAADFLALYLRAQPQMAAALMELLENQVIPRELESTVYLGLELAGTPEARSALIAGLSEKHASRNRARAAAALPDIREPNTETLQALTQTARGAVGESPDDTRLVRNAAGYAIGTLERRTRESNPELADRARSELQTSLASARDVQQQAAALDAISNSGNAGLLKDVRPHLGSQESLVRAHAIEAMGHMQPEANKDLFASLIQNEPDAQLRGAIAATYAEQARRADQTSPKEVLDAAVEQLGREADPRVKGLLIELIGPACSTYAYAQQSLGAQFSRETDPMLLKLIGKYVPADRLGH
ncbi:MAG TPA: HEAT repeat domain-containing protein [Polyangiales bacterium]|nr:HEAT repeat domain-containing protein [Polyangiales bacterium]